VQAAGTEPGRVPWFALPVLACRVGTGVNAVDRCSSAGTDAMPGLGSCAAREGDSASWGCAETAFFVRICQVGRTRYA